MPREDALLYLRSQEKAWNMYCGFLDLSLLEFMGIQEQLLMKQIDTVYQRPLARRFIPQKPKDVSEFRQIVNLTTYEDYSTYLGKKDEDMLAVKPYCWACTSGRGGSPRWVPYTSRAVEMFTMCTIAILILACASRKGEVNIGRGMRLLHNLPPPPHMFGIINELLAPQLGARLIPPPATYGYADFEERINEGLQMALGTGVDMLSSMTSVLVRTGEKFAESSRQWEINRRMLRPQILGRLALAWLRCKKEGRPILPRDLWSFKGLTCYGVETDVYRKQLKYYWGREPLEMYAANEAGTIATQAWNKKGMTFFPAACFWEFIPEEEWLKSRQEKGYQPQSVLLNEVKPGRRYELIITNFHGMPFLRYRLGDLIQIVALEDKEAGIRLPQMVFAGHADDIIDIPGFAAIFEKVLWQTIMNTGVKFEDWSARREYEKEEPILHLYIELREDTDTFQLKRVVHQHLMEHYRSLDNALELDAVKITVIPPGSYQRYYERMKEKGADLARLRPPHMNASDDVIKDLLRTTLPAPGSDA